jgi:hypothetical protein
VALTNETAVEDDANDWSLFDADDVAFGALGTGGTINGWFIYKFNAGGDTLSEVLAIGTLTATPTNGSTFTVTTASGLIKVT